MTHIANIQLATKCKKLRLLQLINVEVDFPMRNQISIWFLYLYYLFLSVICFVMYYYALGFNLAKFVVEDDPPDPHELMCR
jgi:hypothetical protein